MSEYDVLKLPPIYESRESVKQKGFKKYFGGLKVRKYNTVIFFVQL